MRYFFLESLAAASASTSPLPAMEIQKLFAAQIPEISVQLSAVDNFAPNDVRLAVASSTPTVDPGCVRTLLASLALRQQQPQHRLQHQQTCQLWRCVLECNHWSSTNLLYRRL